MKSKTLQRAVLAVSALALAGVPAIGRADDHGDKKQDKQDKQQDHQEKKQDHQEKKQDQQQAKEQQLAKAKAHPEVQVKVVKLDQLKKVASST